MEEERYEQIISHMDKRMDQLEKLVTLSLITDILPEYAENMIDDLSDEIKKLLMHYGFNIDKVDVFSDKVTVYLQSDQRVGIKELRRIKKLLEQQTMDLILVFELDKVTGVQRKKFIEEKISYEVKGVEMFISK